MATAPNEQFDDELLSAYLDGELDAAARAAVDERLRTDERARKLLAELRQASEALKALPRVMLGRDLRGSVLAALEKAAIEPATISTRGGAEVVNSTGRGWMWAGLAVAIAASVMIVAVIPTRLRNEDAASGRQVAVASKDARERDVESGGEALTSAATELADGEAAVQPGAAVPAPAPRSESFAGGAGGKMNGAQRAVGAAAAARTAASEPSPEMLKGAGLPTPATAVDPDDEASGESLADDALDVQVIDAGDAARFDEILAESQIEISDADLPEDVTSTLAGAVGKYDAAIEAVLVEVAPQQLAAIRRALSSRADAAKPYAHEAESAQQLREGQEGAPETRGRAWRLPRRQVRADQAAAPLASAAPAGESRETASGEAGREGLVRVLFLIDRTK